MATPDIRDQQRNQQRRDGGAPAGATDEPTTTAVVGQPEGSADDSRFTDYRPSWWVLPAIGGAMLLAMLVIYLGLNYEQDAVAWGGITLFGLATCALVASFVRYAWLLAREMSDWWRSAKGKP